MASVCVPQISAVFIPSVLYMLCGYLDASEAETTVRSVVHIRIIHHLHQKITPSANHLDHSQNGCSSWQTMQIRQPSTPSSNRQRAIYSHVKLKRSINGCCIRIIFSLCHYFKLHFECGNKSTYVAHHSFL